MATFGRILILPANLLQVKNTYRMTVSILFSRTAAALLSVLKLTGTPSVIAAFRDSSPAEMVSALQQARPATEALREWFEGEKAVSLFPRMLSDIPLSGHSLPGCRANPLEVQTCWITVDAGLECTTLRNWMPECVSLSTS